MLELFCFISFLWILTTALWTIKRRNFSPRTTRAVSTLTWPFLEKERGPRNERQRTLFTTHLCTLVNGLYVLTPHFHLHCSEFGSPPFSFPKSKRLTLYRNSRWSNKTLSRFFTWSIKPTNEKRFLNDPFD